MRAICCDTVVCRPTPWFPQVDRAYRCRKCGRTWIWRVTEGQISSWRRWELTPMREGGL